MAEKREIQLNKVKEVFLKEPSQRKQLFLNFYQLSRFQYWLLKISGHAFSQNVFLPEGGKAGEAD